MKTTHGQTMTYSFACPYPCNRVIRVEAKNFLEAIDKILMAGAMSCRNSRNQFICENLHFEIPPIPDSHLKRIVKLCTREEGNV